ncbi:hypothetical protein GSI_05847 [Ganoderma sinense ZZ0214-1]|uniref:Autophagy-related protein 101 n=1 Tax=Ganoderma sinense ZZ0214-1 TaxID=1077348 RepID=A0A2G8SBL5_9APHY|nr:hypothetical protein GSI_05847 [Ganoderma sinense ZZ0214-1]
MNDGHPTITIDLVLDRLQTKEVLRAILHSILFHRLFGTVRSRTFEVLDVTMEEVPWEQWIINAEIRQPSERERQKFNSDLASTLTKSLQTMLMHASSERGRSAVPLITNAQSISPFPIKITVKVGGVEVA